MKFKGILVRNTRGVNILEDKELIAKSKELEISQKN